MAAASSGSRTRRCSSFPAATSIITTGSSTRSAARPAWPRWSSGASSSAARTASTRRGPARTSGSSGRAWGARAMRRRRWLGSLVLVGVAVATAPAALARAQDGDEPDAEGDSFWAEIAHPHRARYGELITQGTAFLQAGDPNAAATLLEQAVKLASPEPPGIHLLRLPR